MFSRHEFLACACVAGFLAGATPSRAQLVPYSQDFESLAQTSPDALGNDGWLIYGNVFDSAGNHLGGYGAFPAPNGPSRPPGWSDIDVGQGGPPQGDQQLSIYNDYENENHGNGSGNRVEANVYREQSIAAGDEGKTFVFTFDAKKGDIAGDTTAIAFIKTLDPGAGYALTNFKTVNTTNLPKTWGTYCVSLSLPAGVAGQVFQLGFASTASGFEPSANFYDNVDFGEGTDPDSDNDGTTNCFDPDDDNDGISDHYDRQPLVASNLCDAPNEGDSRTLSGATVGGPGDRSCAATASVVVDSASQVTATGDLRVISNAVRFGEFSVHQDGRLEVINADPCEGCPPSDSGGVIFEPLYDENTVLEPIASFVRADGVVVTRFGDRGRDRHAKDIGMYDPNNIFNSDHYDHWLAHYWEYRTARIQLEDHVPNGQSLIRATYITEEQLSAREFRVWFFGMTTTGQFHFNPTATYVGKGTWNDDFVKTSVLGHQHMYTLDITEQWKDVATFNGPLQLGVNMEFEISQFLAAPPAGARKNYYGTSYVYVIGTPGVAPFEWQRGVQNPNGVNDGTPIPPKGLLGGDTTLGYNYSEEPAGRFMQMATNLSPGNAQPFVRGRRVHHTNFEDGIHDERADNPVWTEQIGKAGNHYVNLSCAKCHVRNGRALVADVGVNLDKWVFKLADANGNPDPQLGNVLQPSQTGGGPSEGTVSLGPWTNLANGLRSPNYVFGNGTPARFSARIAPQLVGIGLLEAIPEAVILEWADPGDADNDGISGRAALSADPLSGVPRLGRFGYKAATSSVRHQVAAALNTDIGVMTSLLPDPDCGSAQATCGAAGQELADDELEDLVKYISLLGVGARRDYSDTTGEDVFTNIGCADCHRPTMTTSDYHPLAELRSQTIHPYTDLLLHDMGPGLADNLGEGVATGAEWRTAPLWGLGHARSVMLGDPKANDLVSMAGDENDVNRIGYLHDGRARTFDEAIRWHGGEAEMSKNAYEALSAGDKNNLLEFLGSL